MQYNPLTMNEYIFYTTEGYTIAPDDSYEVDNCQVLGFALGETEEEAKRNLLEQNKWIVEAGFSPCSIISRQVYPLKGA